MRRSRLGGLWAGPEGEGTGGLQAGDLCVAAQQCSPELMESQGGFMDIAEAESTGPGRLGTQVSGMGGGCSW